MELIGIILVSIVLVLGLFLHKPKWHDPQSTQADANTLCAYKLRAGIFVNRSELALFTALNRHKPQDKYVMAKVRLEDILQVSHKVKDGRLRWQYRGRIKARHVDFVLCDAAGRFLCAIELDGNSHENAQAKMVDNFKDAIFNHAGLKLFRVKIEDNFVQAAHNIWQSI